MMPNTNFVQWVVTIGGLAGALTAIVTIITKILDPVNKIFTRIKDIELKRDIADKAISEKMEAIMQTVNGNHGELESAILERKAANAVVFAALMGIIKHEKTGDGEELLAEAEEKIYQYLLKVKE
ncbi:hypothetical protein FACS1894184_21150 [Clostridia bacterium]|nr:hypothetical protein FACS1894184_21150 [Clostridia bacterium]